MNELQTFNFSDREVRVVIKDGEPWWVASDVCNTIGLSNPTEAMKRLDSDEKRTLRITEGGPEINAINESGLYNLILRSNKPEAKQFRKWVTSEVLPQIRRTGQYGMQQLTRMEILQLALKAEQELQAANTKLIEQAPKVEVYEKIVSATNLQTVSQVAKIIGTGQKRLFVTLRNCNVLMSNNVLYQKYVDAGYFEVKEKPITMGSQTINYSQTYVTGKGLVWVKKLIDEIKEADVC